MMIPTHLSLPLNDYVPFATSLSGCLQVRFCPELHTLEGLSDEEAVEAACLGMQDAIDQSSFPLTGGVIICALRSFSEEHSMRMAALSHR